MQYAIEKLTELLIKQDMKDKQTGQKELISKVGAYKSLIDLLKTMKYETYTLNSENMNISYMKGENTNYYKEV